MSQDKIGQIAPPLQVNFLNGSPFTVLAGEPLVISFFSSTCPWCVSEMPRLGKVYDNVKQQGIHVPLVGIVTGDETPESAVQFALNCGLDMPLALDPDGSASAAFGIERVPSVVLIDAKGAISRIYEGASEQLTGIVEQALFAAARGDAAPNFELVGNGCGIEG
jgi:peroxiredoxin